MTRARARYLLKLGRLLPCLVITTGLLAVWTEVAHASLFLMFERTSGRPGTLVHVHTAGEGACLVCPPRMPLYFAGATVADEITAPDDPRLVEVGTLIVDEHGNGSGTVTIPEVKRGGYVLMTYCEPCAPTSGGRVMLPLGPFPQPFEVVGSSVGRPSPTWLRALAGVLAAVFAAAALATARTRRSG